MQNLMSKVGDNADYTPPESQTPFLSNDDQGLWGLVALLAAERNFPNPPADKLQWLQLAENVFNTLTSRWDSAHCGGGLRWQVYSSNAGYNFKDSES